MQNKIKNILKDLEESKQKELKEIKEKYREGERKFRLYLELKEKGVKDIKASSLTCWGGLQWCCATLTEKKEGLSIEGKNCIYRGMCLDLLGLTEQDYIDYKKRMKWT